MLIYHFHDEMTLASAISSPGTMFTAKQTKLLIIFQSLDSRLIRVFDFSSPFICNVVKADLVSVLFPSGF